MWIGGTLLGSIIGTVTAWNLLVVPFLNSDISPVVGAQRYANDLKAQKQIVETLDKTAQTLAKTQQSLDATIRRQDREECDDWNRRLRNYNEALRQNPRDDHARMLRNIALGEIASLPSCMQESP